MAELPCARVRLRIVPNASRSEVVGPYGEALKVRIAAPAVEGKANTAVLAFIAGLVGVPARDCVLISGEKSRDKVVQISGFSTKEALIRLLPPV